MSKPINPQKVRCPNWCSNGQVKTHPHPGRALWAPKTCTFCKGKGKVTLERAVEIEAEL